MGKDRVYTIWRHEGLKVPRSSRSAPDCGVPMGPASGSGLSCRNHVWSYDFVADRTHDGRPFRILNILDEYTRECLASVVARRIRSHDVLLILADLFLSRGIPTHIRSDNGPEFIARKLTTLADRAAGRPALYRARLTLGEWLLRII